MARLVGWLGAAPRSLDLHQLNKAMMYIRENEQGGTVTIVHVTQHPDAVDADMQRVCTLLAEVCGPPPPVSEARRLWWPDSPHALRIPPPLPRVFFCVCRVCAQMYPKHRVDSLLVRCCLSACCVLVSVTAAACA
jgi:hypothetical protein